ncbi:MAG: DUF1573 domain-containing protein, partial [Proteobacteria bacterium]|nr:DUF1573 domain-containing protein [Pseudomonadota bacterium]
MSYFNRIKSDPIIALVIIFLGIAFFSPQKENAQTAPPVIEKAAALEKTTQTDTSAGPGRIVFDHAFHDFGKVMEGDIVKHTFDFKNEGPGAVKIVKTKTSCGCTTAKAALKDYASGESGKMEITIDTRGKKGIVVKTTTVYLENSVDEIAELTLTMQLERPPHPKVGNVLNINKDPKCKTCHLDKGVGQKGVFLYHRICAQCHGKKGRGA